MEMWACRFPTTKRKSPMQWPHHVGTAVAAAATTAAATVPTHRMPQ